MIIVKITDGLGNQMFQYACARALAARNNDSLYLDLDSFKESKSRKFGLNLFNIDYREAKKEEILRLSNPEGTKPLCYGKSSRRNIIKEIKWFLFKDKSYKATHIYEKRPFRFDSKIYRLTGDLYLDGLFLCYKYFDKEAAVLRKEFTLKDKAIGKNVEFAESIKNCESISLHIRRTDYATVKHFKNNYLLSDNYFNNAVNMMIKLVKNPVFFVFSDEPEWAKENLKIDAPMYIVDHNGIDSGHEDMRLMSLCKHNIIANSTFS